jgi:hypothetical protein
MLKTQKIPCILFFLEKRYDFSVYCLRELAICNTQEDIVFYFFYVLFVRPYLAKRNNFFLEVKITQNKLKRCLSNTPLNQITLQNQTKQSLRIGPVLTRLG